MDIEPSARKHRVADDDMLHAFRNHWKAHETNDPDVTMFIGPSRSGDPLEVGVVIDDDGVAIIHAMRARPKFLKGMVDTMSPTRAERATTLEAWADEVDDADLVEIDTDSLKAIAAYADRLDHLETALAEAVRQARRDGRSWSAIGTMLGVSKQAAQRKYSKLAS